MFVLKYNCFIICVILLGVLTGSEAAACSTAYDFDYLLLSVQWPESFCETTACAAHDDIWSIHGAWPQYNSGSWPEDCCFESEFRIDQLKTIETELNKHWKTLKAADKNSDSFWAHEWQKHGTCAMNAPLLKGELNYFKNTLAAFNKLSIEKWLSTAKIVPSLNKAYNVTEFHSAIAAGLGHRVQLDCLSKKYNTSPILTEIHFCLNKQTLEPYDCPTNLSDTNCGKGTIAYLPTK